MAIHKGIEYKATYKSDFSGLKKDLKKLDKQRKDIASKPILVPIKLDLKGFRKSAAAAKKEIQSELAKIKATASGSTVSEGGIIIPKEATSSYKKYQQQASDVIRTVNKEWEGTQKRIEATTRTLQKGLKETTSRSYKADGQPGAVTTTTTDNRKLEKLRDDLRGIESRYGRKIGAAVGSKDKLREIDLLTKKADEYSSAIADANKKGFGDSSDIRKAEQSLDRINQRVANLTGDTQRSSQSNRYQEIARATDRRLQSRLKENLADQEQAKALPNKIQRESALNGLYQKREAILNQHQRIFQKLDAAAQRRARPDLANKAMGRALGIGNQIDQNNLDISRTENRAKINARKEALKKELNLVQRKAKEELALSKVKQQQLNILQKSSHKQQQMNAILAARSGIYSKLGMQLQAIEARAGKQGFTSIAGNASAARANFSRQAIPDLTNLEKAHRNSGHAVNFHTGSLLKNAATFASWYAPVQLVLGALNALQAGVSGAIKVDRQFATLRAVFRGSSEDAQQLKEDTIQLAIAQGQSAETAMDAAVRWSRLGLSRVQVLQAVQTSLVAANVAEISAAESAEKLAAIYATYNLSLADVSSTLDRLNAISNRYNVTNKDLLEGIVRVAAVAKQAKLAQRDLEGIIGAVTGATGRPGSEVGNTLKFVLQRIRRPETLEKLNQDLDIDLTQPNGQVKEASVLLKELAEIYPTLSRNQQSMLLDYTAGSRQAARFALVLSEWRQGQILAAEAAFDTGSAMKENEKILESVEAHLNSLKSAWTELFVTMGDTGIIAAIAGKMQELSDSIANVSEGLKIAQSLFKGNGGDGEFGNKEVRLSSRHARNAFSKPLAAKLPGPAGSIASAIIGNKKTATVDEIKQKIKSLEALKKLQESSQYIPDAITAQTSKKLEALKNILGAEETGQVAATISSVGKEINNLRSQVVGLEKGEKIFNSLAQSISKGGEETKKVLRDWRNAANLLIQLEGGGKKFAENFGKVDELISSGDTEAASKIISELSKEFNAEAPGRRAAFTEKQNEISKELHKTYADLIIQQKELAKGFDGLEGDAAKKHNEEFNALNDKIKTTRKEIKGVDADLEKLASNKGLEGSQTVQLNKYLEKANRAATALSQTLTSLNIAGANNPDRALRSAVQAASINSQRAENLFAETQTRGNSTIGNRERDIKDSQAYINALKANPRMDTASLDEELALAKSAEERSRIQQIMNGRNTVNTAINSGTVNTDYQKGMIDSESDYYTEVLKEQVNAQKELAIEAEKQVQINRDLIAMSEMDMKKAQEELAIKKEQLALEREQARLKQAFETGAENSAISARQYLIGANNSEQIINQSKTLSELNLNDLSPDSDSAVDILSKRATLLQNEAQQTRNIVALRQRDADITASLANSQFKLGEAMKQQTEEQSKRLMLASREDQLRAAMATAATQEGNLSTDEFSFLSQKTRGTFNNFAKQRVTGLGGAEETITKENEALKREQENIRQSMNGLTTSLDTFSTWVDSFITAYPIKDKNLGFKNDGLQDRFGKNKPAQIEINTGDVNIEVGKQFEELTKSLADNINSKLSTEIEQIRRTVDNFTSSSTRENAADFTN